MQEKAKKIATSYVNQLYKENHYKFLYYDILDLAICNLKGSKEFT
jgi:ATP phosphoribosyltransferase